MIKKVDEYTYDCPVYKFICGFCGEYFHADKAGSYCPICGRKNEEGKAE